MAAELKEETRYKIGQGAYACVYSPPFTCKDHALPEKYQTTEYVSKITSNLEEVENELMIKKKLDEKKIDYENHLILPEREPCIIDLELNLWLSCRMLQNPVYNVVERNGGANFQELILPTSVPWAWKQLQHLLQGLSLLHQVNMYHLDIKAQNVLLDDTDTLRIIDFGLSQTSPPTKPSIFNNFYQDAWPLFVSVLAMRPNVSKRRLQENIQDLKLAYLSIDATSDPVTPLVEQYVNIGPERYVTEIIAPNMSKIDAYGASRIFSGILSKLRGQPGYIELEYVIMKMKDPDIQEQWNVEQGLVYLQKHEKSVTPLALINRSDQPK